MSDKAQKISYWIATSVFVVGLSWSAIQYLVEAPKMVATITGLGYPVYFMKLLGVAKLLGVVAIVIGRFETLKEWAYAGFSFNLIAASVSHVASGDPAWKAAVPLAFLAVLMVSYAAWKRLRRAVALPPARTPKLRTYAASGA
jgi:apolipoprotein N-acyltransferase